MPRSGTLVAGPRAAAAAGVRADLHMGEKAVSYSPLLQ